MKSIPPNILWPGIVVTLLLANIGIAFGTLFLSKSDGGAGVVDEYYSAAVAWDSLSAARHFGEELDWTVRIDTDRIAQVAEIHFSDSNGLPIEGLDVKVTLDQPHHSATARQFMCTEVAPGTYRASDLHYRLAGLYDFTLAAEWQGRPLQIKRRREVR